MGAAKRVVGRESDLASLRAAQHEASGALVVGPAGVGKTYLVRSFLDELADRGGRVETFVGSKTTQQVPLGALSPVLAQADLVNSGEFVQLTQAICSLLGEDEGSPTPALMFDDADLLDAASADVVHQLASSRRASVWLTVRTGEPIPAPIDALWRSGAIQRIDLQPINRDEATRIAEELLDGELDPSAASALWDLTLGFPLYVREAVNDFVASGVFVQGEQAWEITGPFEPGQRVQDLLVRRLDRLSATDRTLVEMVALAEPVAASLLNPSDQDAAIRLIRRGLLQWRDASTRDALVSAHPLLASCSRAVVSPARAQEVLNALADQAAGMTDIPYGTNLGLVEAARAVGVEVAATTLVAAAREALASFRPADALAIANSAVGLDPDHPGAHHAAGELLQMAGDDDGAHRHLARALELSTEDDEIARIAFTLANLLGWAGGDPRSAIAVLQRAAKRLSSPMAQLAMSVDTAVIASLLGRFPEVLETGYEILGVEGLDDTTRGITLSNICLAQCMLLELDRFDADWAAAIALTSDKRLGDRPGEVDVLWAVKGGVIMARGDFRDGLAELETHLATCRADGSYRGVAALIRSHMLIAKGDAEARGAVDESISQLEAMDQFNTMAHAQAAGAIVATLTGDDAGAARHLAEIRDDAIVDDPRAIVWLGRARAGQAAAAGDLEEAASLAATAGTEAIKRNFSAWGLLALHDAVRYRHPSMVVEQLADFATCGAPFIELLAEHAHAASLGDAGALRLVARKFSSMGAALHAGEAWLDVALEEVDEARRQVAVVAAQFVAADVALDRWFLWSGVEPVLSPRETEVASAAVSGGSSKDIAEALFVSVRTVDNHLGRIYRRLGLAGRTDLIETFRP